MEQLVLNTIVAASVYALVGAGFALTYRCSRFFNFALGGLVAAGAYFCYFALQFPILPLFVSFFVGIALTVMLGCVIELMVYGEVGKRGGTSLGLLLVSVGVYIFIQNMIALGFGNETKVLLPGYVMPSARIMGVTVTAAQAATVGTAAAALISLAALLRLTRLGRMIRAVASDAELARIRGFDVPKILLSVTAIGSALAGAAGLLVALDVNMVPAMGMRILLMSIASVIIGGATRQISVPGIAAGATLVAALQNLGVWNISTAWQDTIIFGCLMIALLLRPEGIVKARIRKA